MLTPLSAEGPRCPPWWSCASLGMARQGIRGHLLLRLPALAGLLAAVAGGFSKCAFDGEQQACLRFLGGDADHPPASATALGLSLETVRTECPVLLRRIVPACPSLVFGEAWLSACSPAEASPISLTATRLARIVGGCHACHQRVHAGPVRAEPARRWVAASNRGAPRRQLRVNRACGLALMRAARFLGHCDPFHIPPVQAVVRLSAAHHRMLLA